MNEVRIDLRAGISMVCKQDGLQMEYTKQRMLSEFQAFIADLTVETTNFHVEPIVMISGRDLIDSTPSREEWQNKKNEQYRNSMNMAVPE